MTSFIKYAVMLVVGFSTVTQADEISIQTLTDGSTALTVKGSDIAFSLYNWFRYATQKDSVDERNSLLKGQSFYLNSYSTDGMSFEYTAKFIFDNKKNKIHEENKQIVFEGQNAFLLTQGAVIFNAINGGGISIKQGVFFGDFQVTSESTNFMCERTTLPIPNMGQLVQLISRCIIYTTE